LLFRFAFDEKPLSFFAGKCSYNDDNVNRHVTLAKRFFIKGMDLYKA